MEHLEVRNLSKQFGGVVAVDNCSLNLEHNLIHGLIGPNGSGKTTLFNLITGFVKPNSGRVLYKGEDITGLSPRAVARRGIVRTFQLTRIFPNMTVEENLMTVSKGRGKEEPSRIEELLTLFELEMVAHDQARNLSYGQKKQLEFSRMLLLDSDVILLDEPMAGLTKKMTDKMCSYIGLAKKEGKTILVIEHNLPLITGLCEKIFVLDNGRKIAEGTPSDIRHNPDVMRAYIGEM